MPTPSPRTLDAAAIEHALVAAYHGVQDIEPIAQDALRKLNGAKTLTIDERHACARVLVAHALEQRRAAHADSIAPPPPAGGPPIGEQP